MIYCQNCAAFDREGHWCCAKNETVNPYDEACYGFIPMEEERE